MPNQTETTAKAHELAMRISHFCCSSIRHDETILKSVTEFIQEELDAAYTDGWKAANGETR